MAKLLYIEASPRKDRSSSIAVAREFIAAYTEAHPDDVVETIDLWALDMPPFDGATISAKYKVLHGLERSADEDRAWETVAEFAGRLKKADKILISSPMWNFSIPYRLKHFIDIVVQPGLTFTVSPGGEYNGLLAGRPAALVLARGGEYGDGTTYDYQRTYLKLILGFMGITDVREIIVEPTIAEKGTVARAKDAAMAEAKKLGAAF